MVSIKKISTKERKSNATGSPTVSRSTWLIVRDADGKVLDTASSAKQANERLRFLPATDKA